MNTLTRFGLILILALCLAACGGEAGGPENVFIADGADNGETVVMGVGDVLQVTLAENRSTGYVWSIVTNDEAVLRLTDEPAYEVEGEPLPGAGGHTTYLFEAAAPGTSVLSMVHARPQETAVEPGGTFELTVQVTE